MNIEAKTWSFCRLWDNAFGTKVNRTILMQGIKLTANVEAKLGAITPHFLVLERAR